MDDRRFDSLVRAMARGGSRRTLLKGWLGFGAMAASAAVVHDTQAARRGYPGPQLPRKPTPEPGADCDPSTCYGCNSCIDGQCVGNPADCYVHACMASVCDSDGGCRYPFDCRQGTSCCGPLQICNTSTGQCECNPADKCCGVQCNNGCVACINGECTEPDDSLCPTVPGCWRMVCQADGVCMEVGDCRTGSPGECCIATGASCGSDGQCTNDTV